MCQRRKIIFFLLSVNVVLDLLSSFEEGDGKGFAEIEPETQDQKADATVNH
jgi:hypothetical protein